MAAMTSWEDLATLATRLDPSDQLRLVERIVHGLTTPQRADGAPRAPILGRVP